jgi:N-acetylglutamate synthase-like GNAT family acetyltransferase
MKALNVKTLEDFLSVNTRNAWISKDGQNVYVRKSMRNLDGPPAMWVFDIANIETPPKKQGKGRFKQFLSDVENALQGTTYEAIYIENVQVPRFADYFRRTGWTEVQQGVFAAANLPCFYKILG